MDYPIRAESGKGRSAHIFNLNERAVVEKLVTGVVFVVIGLSVTCLCVGIWADFFATIT